MPERYTSRVALVLDRGLEDVGAVVGEAVEAGDLDRAAPVRDRGRDAQHVYWGGRMQRAVVRRVADEEDAAPLLRTECYIGGEGLREGLRRQAELTLALARRLPGRVRGVRDLSARVDRDRAWLDRVAGGRAGLGDAVVVRAASDVVGSTVVAGASGGVRDEAVGQPAAPAEAGGAGGAGAISDVAGVRGAEGAAGEGEAGDGGVWWLRTHGAARLDVPDLELYGLARAQLEAATAALGRAHRRLLEGGLTADLSLPDGTPVYLVPVREAWGALPLDWPGVGRAGQNRGPGLTGPRATLSVLHPPRFGRYRTDLEGVLERLGG